MAVCKLWACCAKESCLLPRTDWKARQLPLCWCGSPGERPGHVPGWGQAMASARVSAQGQGWAAGPQRSTHLQKTPERVLEFNQTHMLHCMAIHPECTSFLRSTPRSSAFRRLGNGRGFCNISVHYPFSESTCWCRSALNSWGHWKITLESFTSIYNHVMFQYNFLKTQFHTLLT